MNHHNHTTTSDKTILEQMFLGLNLMLTSIRKLFILKCITRKNPVDGEAAPDGTLECDTVTTPVL